jgi:hypothetical protein
MSQLANTIKQLNQNYDTNKEQVIQDITLKWNMKQTQANIDAMNAILLNHEQRMLDSAECGLKESRIFDWFHSAMLTFNGCYLNQLLTRGTLLQVLQSELDQRHGVNEFKVYYMMHYRGGDKLNMIIVSWNQDDFSRIDGIIEKMYSRSSQASHEKRHPNQTGFRNCSAPALWSQIPENEPTIADADTIV